MRNEPMPDDFIPPGMTTGQMKEHGLMNPEMLRLEKEQQQQANAQRKEKKSNWQYIINLLFGLGGVLLGAWLSKTDNSQTETLLKRQVVLLEQISTKLKKDTVVQYQTHSIPDTARYK